MCDGGDGFGLEGAHNIDKGEFVFATVVYHGKDADDVVVLGAHVDGDVFAFFGDAVGGFPAEIVEGLGDVCDVVFDGICVCVLYANEFDVLEGDVELGVGVELCEHGGAHGLLDGCLGEDAPCGEVDVADVLVDGLFGICCLEK